MQQLGTTFNISNELLREGEEAMGVIYGHKQQHNVKPSIDLEVKEMSEANLYKCKDHLIMPSEARRKMFLKAIQITKIYVFFTHLI